MSSTGNEVGRVPKVLVVEDDRGVRESLQVVLQVQKYEVTGVERGEDALGVIESSPIDLIVLDLNLPGIDGIETCRRVRCLLYTSPSPRDKRQSRMPSSA